MFARIINNISNVLSLISRSWTIILFIASKWLPMKNIPQSKLPSYPWSPIFHKFTFHSKFIIVTIDMEGKWSLFNFRKKTYLMGGFFMAISSIVFMVKKIVSFWMKRVAIGCIPLLFWVELRFQFPSILASPIFQTLWVLMARVVLLCTAVMDFWINSVVDLLSIFFWSSFYLE